MTTFGDQVFQFGGIPVGSGGFDWAAVGNIYWVATSGGTMQDLLNRRHIDSAKIFTTLSAAYAETTSGQNDVVFVTPGAHVETAEIAWSKDNTHCIGLGGPVTHADYSEKNVVVYTVTAQQNYVVNLTGDHCIFRNIGLNNAGNHATNLAAMLVNGYGNLFDSVSFIGNMAANQLSAVAAGSLAISTNGHNCRWNNCVIGEDCWGARTGARSGQLIFSGSQPNGGIMRDTIIKSQSSTVAVGMVRVVPIGIGRGWLFERCTFLNYGTSNLNQVFASSVNDTTHSWTQISLKDCAAFGVDEWSDHSVDAIYGNMPAATDDGGMTLALDAAAS